MRTKLAEPLALAQLQRTKAAYQSHIKLNFEPAAESCATCTTKGDCCTDAHFVNVHITRLEAVAMRETIARTPRLDQQGRRAVYSRARAAVELYGLGPGSDSFARTYSCPLYVRDAGCLVHRRAKPAPCIQHACYENWEDLPPQSLQSRTEHRIENLNQQVYGNAWAWLATPVWLTLVDPECTGAELERLTREWNLSSRMRSNRLNSGVGSRRMKDFGRSISLPVLARMAKRA